MSKLKSSVLIIAIVALATVSVAQQIYTTQKGYMVATSKENLKLGMKYLAAKDYVAVKSLIDQGKAASLRPGQKVYLEDVSWGLVQIRPVGMTGVLWTVMEAIE